MQNSFFTFDTNESFPKLANPPLVEAVIHWQARAAIEFNQANLQSLLKNEFPQFRTRKPIHQFGVTAHLSTELEKNFVEKTTQWDGLRLTTEDGKYVIQFTRNGLVFSRTNGYEDWETFSAAAKQAWETYLRIAKPPAIERLGVRFINQIPTATPESIDLFLVDPPTFSKAKNLQLKEFVYQSTIALPASPFEVRVIKVMQQSTEAKESGLFLDIDVFTNSVASTGGADLEETLRKMRWLKNKVFFTLITTELGK